MKKKLIIFFIVISLPTFSQETVREISQQLSENKNIFRQELEVKMTFVRIDSSQNEKSVFEASLELGKYKGKYLVISEKIQNHVRSYGVLQIENEQYSLDDFYDEISGEKLPNEFIIGGVRAFSINFYEKQFLCLVAITNTFGSAHLYQNVYLFDLNGENKQKYAFLMKYAYEDSFGDFNNDRLLDVYKWTPNNKLYETANPKELIRDYMEAKAYTLTEKRFIPLETDKFIVQIKIKRDFKIDIIKYQWFY